MHITPPSTDSHQTAIEATQRIDALASLGPAKYIVGPSAIAHPYAMELSERGLFVVFPGVDEPTNLTPPIDWSQDPYGSQSWQAQLHTLRFLAALFSRYESQADLSALRSACDIALDWVCSNERGSEEKSRFAWGDKIAGDRAPFLGYLLRAASFEGLLSRAEASTLLGSALDHVDFLLDDSQYTQYSNHGLAQDVGLVLLSGYLEFLDDAASWRRKGVERFIATLSAHLASGEGIYLEHSPHYQWMIGNLIRRFKQAANVDDKRLNAIQDEVQRAATWLVLPDGRTPPLGDSDFTKAPKWAHRRSEDLCGLKLFRRAGIAVCRRDRSMLIISAGCHSRVHKHADELGFCLYEGDSLLLGEAGKYGYDKSDPAREYAQSAFAHSVLLVDGMPFPRAGEIYGSALERAGSGLGLHAVEGSNPLLRKQGVEHARLFLYRPGRMLVVVDKIRSSDLHSYTRLFHFGPDTHVDPTRNGVLRFAVKSVKGELADVSGCVVESDVRVAQRRPVLSGWMFPQYREWVPVPTVSLKTSGNSALLGAALFIGTPESVRVSGHADGGTAVILGTGSKAEQIGVHPVGTNSLTVTR